MKTLFKMPVLLLAQMLVVSCGDSKKEEGKKISTNKELIEYYDSGAVKSKVNYVDDKKQGEEIWYYESGAVKGIGKYVDGNLQGEGIEYFENGAVKSKYKNGVLIKD